RHRERFNTLRGWRPDRELFRRLLRFGMPSGVEHVLTMMGLSLFVLLVGRLGQVELAATNIVMNIGWMAFLPMIGLTVAVTTLVGRYLGENQPDISERAVWCGFRLVVIYGGVVAAAYVLIPEIILSPFAANADPETFPPIREVGIVLLKFLAAFTVFDYACLMFSSGIKGAGDTKFVMWVFTSLTWTLLVFPTYLACVVFDWGIYVAWAFETLFVIVAGFVFLLRFRGGKWKSMRVIEPETETLPLAVPPPVPDRGLDGGPPGLEV
ncbi:MAG: MATE family efflux transporter, partial [Candidatus Latescibacteria bacterium]|nr:MATE family efflux transporter [Candidatus Latescibacterota bacterium]